MSKKKLLIFHPTIAPYRIDLFNSLSKSFDVKVCLSYRNLRSQTFDYDSVEKQFLFKPHYLKKRFEIHNRVICKGYWKEIKDFQPDIILCSEFGLDCISALSFKRIYKKKYKVVSLCDDSFDMVNNNNDFSVFHKRMRKLLVPLLDSLILVEPDTTRWYLNNYGKGIYFPIVSEDDKTRTCYKKALPITKKYIEKYQLMGKKVFLFVGRLVKIKNVKQLIESFEEAGIEDAILVIVGDGEERDNLKKQSEGLSSKIIFTGRLEGDSLYAWYNLASCFVLPSLKEAFGAVTNEALLGGAKVIVSEKAGSKCLVVQNINGLTFNPDKENALKQSMVKISSNIDKVEAHDDLRISMMQKTYTDYFNDLKKSLLEI